MMTLVEVLHMMRSEPHRAQYAQLLHDAYLDTDPLAAAERFSRSAEFAAVHRLLAESLVKSLNEAVILDLGAGTGIASYTFARAGVKQVYALEPAGDEELGRAAIRRVTAGMAVETIDACGERIPLADNAVDVVYVRQVLHHASDLSLLLGEAARVLRSRGVLLACREHVADDEQQLAQFLAQHPVHIFAGGENAFPLPTYLSALSAAGLTLKRAFGAWDTIINAYPHVRTSEEFDGLPQALLEQRFGRLSRLFGARTLGRVMLWRLRRRRDAGRLYTFLAVKP